MLSGISLFLLGAFTLIIPLYKILCEKWGFSIKTTHKDYSVKKEDINVHKKWVVNFKSRVDPDLDW